jgi:hypothetical protein
MKKQGEKAPDSQVNLADGSRERLSSYWKGGRLVLVFLRHLG